MKQFYTLLLAGSMLALGLVSCEKPGVEIRDSDYSYTLDPKKINVDIPEEYIYNNSPLFYIQGENPLFVGFMSKPNEDLSGAIVYSEKTIPVTVALDKVSEQDVVMNLAFSEEKNAQAKEQMPTAMDLPLDKLVFPATVTVPAGEYETTFNITVADDLSGLAAEGTYLTTLAFTTSDGNVARTTLGRNMIVVTMANSSLQNVEGNVVHVDAMVPGVSLMDRTQMTAKVTNSLGLAKVLIDGDKRTDPFSDVDYITPRSTGTMEVQVSVSPTMVKGFTLTFTGSDWFGNNVPTDFDVYVSGNNGSSWFKQGSVHLETEDLTQHFIFLNPVNVTTVQIRNSRRADWANYVEWEFYSGTEVTDPGTIGGGTTPEPPVEPDVPEEPEVANAVYSTSPAVSGGSVKGSSSVEIMNYPNVGESTQGTLLMDGGGNGTGYQMPKANNPEIYITLPGSTNLSFIYIRNDNAGAGKFLTSFRVETSNDMFTWTNQGTVTVGDPSRTSFWVNFTNPVTCSFVKLSALESNDPSVVEIQEFDIHKR